jgi:intraflagellar transport protein 46
MDNSEDFGDEFSDEFEESNGDMPTSGKKGAQSFANKPYDEALDISQDLSMAESFDGREKEKMHTDRQRKLENDKYDEALDVSQSMDYKNTPPRSDAKGTAGGSSGKKARGGAGADGDDAGAKAIMNKPFDEALEFSQSGSDDSVDTFKGAAKRQAKAEADDAPKGESLMPSQSIGGLERPTHTGGDMSPLEAPVQQQQRAAPKVAAMAQEESEEDSEEEDDEDDADDADAGDESYENLEGAYNPKDYAHLNVTADTRDLFQYIDRYKPQEMELETELKCFIPEYIPAIGDMDAFIKLPRPDDTPEELGLRYLDEPSATQSDPTVLELQLRAMSKKQQYGDVVVRSIENASKNPEAIDKWVQNIQDLHRRKPPPQVHYKKNMPEVETLMEMWPEEFEAALKTLPLPSPDLDLSLGEYSKVLCSILDIPTYDNPVESLHLMFSLYMDFRDNPHFQAMLAAGNKDMGATDMYGGADVMEIKQGK